MLVSSVLSSDLGAIPGPRLLVAGQDFNCIKGTFSVTSCYAIKPEIHEAFTDLQRQLNRFSGPAGFKPTYVDGKLGADTASAIRDVAEYVVYHFTSAGKTIQDFTAPMAKDAIAQQALFIRLWVKAFADSGQQSGLTTSVIPGPQPPMQVPSRAPTPALPTAAPAPSASPVVVQAPTSKASWWIASGIALTIAGGIGFAAWRRRRYG